MILQRLYFDNVLEAVEDLFVEGVVGVHYDLHGILPEPQQDKLGVEGKVPGYFVWVPGSLVCLPILNDTVGQVNQHYMCIGVGYCLDSDLAVLLVIGIAFGEEEVSKLLLVVIEKDTK